MVRGIERRKIFANDADRDQFLSRLGEVLEETKTICYAWALLPNHFHLLIRTGPVPISTTMRQLLTGYAVWYNRTHRRHGHLFRNRFKSILCQEDAYLVELVRYIHLNPIRAGIVGSVLAGAGEEMEKRYWLPAHGYDLEKVGLRVSAVLGVDPGTVWKKGRYRDVVEARSLFCYWAVRELGVAMSLLAGKLGISIPAVSKSVIRGQRIAEEGGYSLVSS
jgi:REP element-mobilizing transposase RayT